MRLRFFCPIDIIDADPPSRLTEPEKLITLQPGPVYEFEEIPNPCCAGGLRWYVLRGTKQGLPCEFFERRIRYGPGCVLRIERLSRKQARAARRTIQVAAVA